MSVVSHNRIEVMHGVNLDVLVRRAPEHYGTLSLSELEVRIKRWARELGLEAAFFQTNHEGEYVEHLHRLAEVADGAILNPGSWTHYSYAIRDALEIFSGPIVEVHLSDISQREEWRRQSVIADVVSHRIAGRGAEGYRDAFTFLLEEQP